MTDYIMNTYPGRQIAFVQGEGTSLYTAEGKEYLDFTAGIAVNSLGHCHPHLVKTLCDQAAKLWHTSNMFRVPDGDRLALRLCQASFADRAFFCNSGVEAFEAAVKLTRRYQDVTGHPERWRIITCKGAFHGRSLNAIAAAGNPKYLEGFDPVTPGFDHAPFGNMNEIRNLIGEETAGILVEPIQGEGGIHAAPEGFLRALRKTCDEYGLVLIYDEVQCGMGRTGKLFAHEWSEAEAAPHIMMLAKGLGGGFPIGAILADEKTATGFTPGTHGTTFGGNPLAMSIANAVLDVMLEPEFLPHVLSMSAMLRSQLSSLVDDFPDLFAEVRGTGLMLGLVCRVPNHEMIAALRNAGLLTVGAADNVIRLLPPLILTQRDIVQATDILRTVSKAFEKVPT